MINEQEQAYPARALLMKGHLSHPLTRFVMKKVIISVLVEAVVAILTAWANAQLTR